MKAEWTRVDQSGQESTEVPHDLRAFGGRSPFWGAKPLLGALLGALRFWRNDRKGDLGPLAFLGGKNVPVKDASAL